MKLALMNLALLALAPSASAQQDLQGKGPQGLHDLFGQVLLAADHAATGNELWSATAAGSALVADLNAGPGDAFYYADTAWYEPTGPRGTVLGGDFYFLANLVNGKLGLGRTDGTTGGTSILYEFVKSTISGIPFGYTLDGVGLVDRVVFAARRDLNGWGVWSTDGTSAGTQLLAGTKGQGLGFTRLGNAAVFFSLGFTSEVWRTDGTPAGTLGVLGLPPGTVVDPDSPTVLGDEVIFVAGDSTTGKELWQTDGTGPGTSLLRDVLPGTAGSDPEDLVRVGDWIYFSAEDGIGGRDLWRTDGTSAGTQLVFSLPFGYPEGPRHLTAFGDLLAFAHGLSGSKDRLYTHDPVTGNLDLVAELAGTGGKPEGIGELTAVGSRRLFFRGYDALHGKELWVSDGTTAGTMLFEDLQPGVGVAAPEDLLLSDGRLFFVADMLPALESLNHRDVGATAQPVGVGCSASGRLPILTADDPVLGGSSRLRIEGAEPSVPVLVFYGPQVAPTALGSGCFAHLDPATVTLLTAGQTDPSGAWSSAPLPVPGNPALTDAQFVLQALVGPTGTAPLGFDLSSAVLMNLGS